MFTGLIECCGKIRELTRTANGANVKITAPFLSDDVLIGASISVNGVCLTVTRKDNEMFAADMSPETLNRTTFSIIQSGDLVNLERALRMGDRFGGHIVTGHIDAVAEVKDVTRQANAVVISISLPEEYSRYLAARGSVSVDGISLTINKVEGNLFSVSIIPHTLEMTTLKDCRPGQKVNIETDVLGKYVERLLGFMSNKDQSNVTREFLAKHGFM